MIGAPEIIFIVLIVLVLFGGKKIPELMRGLGIGVKSVKQGMLMDEDIQQQIEPEDKIPSQPTQEQHGEQA